MKVRVRVIFPDHTVGNWFLTTEHPQSSHNLPVLVDQQNQPFGPGDLPVGTVIRVQTKDILAAEGAKMAGYQVVS